MSLNGKFSENLILFIIVSFVFMSTFGMDMGIEAKDGQMSSCPFMANETSICQMSVMEHISQWQQIFLGIPGTTNFLALALMLVAIVLVAFGKRLSLLQKLTELAEQISARQKEHLVKVFDPFLVAFSDGILHPKIYSFLAN